MDKINIAEWIFQQLEEKGNMRETASIRNIQFNIDTSDYLELKAKAKKIEQEQRDLEFSRGYCDGFTGTMFCDDCGMQECKCEKK